MRLERRHWRALHAVWGASNTDWMQLRRAVMAGLTAICGSKYDPIRCRVVERMPKFKLDSRDLQLTVGQFRNMLAGVPEAQRAILVAISAAGLRISEYERLEPQHLIHNSCTIVVPGEKSDSSQASVSVDPIYWPLVVRAVPAGLKRGGVRGLLIRACKAARIQRIRLHDLRKCLGHFAAEGGASREELQVALRHASPAMTAIYTTKPKVGNIAAAFAKAVGVIAGGNLETESGPPIHNTTFKESVGPRVSVPPAASSHAPSREQLYELVWQKTVESVGADLGMTGTAVRKRCQKLGIPTPPRGYWQRKEKGYVVMAVPPLLSMSDGAAKARGLA